MGENETHTPAEIQNLEGDQNNQAATPQVETNASKKVGVKRSAVWDYFTEVENPPDGKKRAACNYCGKTYASHSKTNGTRSLLNHIENQCKRKPPEKGQTTLSFKPGGEGEGSRGLVSVAFSVEACKRALAEMIITDELPFKFVENEGFKKFMHIAVPKWIKLPNRAAIKEECMKVYESEKMKLKKALKGQRVCLTTDTWTSIQNLNYMCLTAHFIDHDWIMRKRILNFGIVEDHRGKTLGRVMEDWLHDWGIDKILTITVDNASSNAGLIEHIKRRTKDRSETILKHEFLHMRCCAHILNLIVKDGLKEYDVSISRVRNAVRYVKASPQRYRFFKRCANKVHVECEAKVCLDVPTRWNYTYEMLNRALMYRRAFERLEEDDTGFSTSLDGDDGGGLGTPDSTDWGKVELFVEYLKTFYEATVRFSGSNYVTLSEFFSEIVLIQDTVNFHLNSRRNETIDEQSQSPFYLMAKNMQAKFSKYWGDLDKMNLLLYMGIILDPRYKLKLVDFKFEKNFGKEEGAKMTDKLRNTFQRLYDAYVVEDISNNAQSSEDGSRDNPSNNTNNQPPKDLRATMLFEFRQHLKEVNMNMKKSDVEKYLSEECEDVPEDVKFDVLEWWKSNSSRFRVLSLVARDVLAVPVSTVASESAFSTSGRVIDSFRSSLNPSTVEALICTQNWIRSSPINLRDSLNDIEELEQEFDSMGTEDEVLYDATPFDLI